MFSSFNFQRAGRVLRPLVSAHVAQRAVRCEESRCETRCEDGSHYSYLGSKAVGDSKKRLPRLNVSYEGRTKPTNAHKARDMMKAPSKVHGNKLFPVYSLDEVRQMADTNQERIVLAYQDGVFDVTNFECKHPGGQDLIRGASGGLLEDFWSMYQVHHKNSVQNILEKYRIGVLHVDDRISNVEDPYDNEPARHPSAKVLQAKPYFDEIPLSKLADDYYTPNELVYVRNHFPTPDIAAEEAESHEVEFSVPAELLRSSEGSISSSVLSLKNLKERFEEVSVDSAIFCTGFR